MYKVYEDTNMLFKILPCSLLIIFIIMCLCVPVFGVSVQEVTNNGSNLVVHSDIYNSDFYFNTKLSNYEYLILFSETGAQLFIAKPDSNFYFDLSNGTQIIVRNSGGYFRSLGITSTDSTAIQDYFDRLNDNWFDNTLPNQLTTEYSAISLSYMSGEVFGNINYDILDENGNVLYSSFTNPFIVNTVEELSTANFNYLQINSGDYTEDLYLLCYDYSNSEDVESIYPRNEILLNVDSEYYAGISSKLEYLYGVPQRNLGIDLKER